MSLADILEELEAAKDPEKVGPNEAYMPSISPFLGLRSWKNALYKKSIFQKRKTRVIDWDFVDICWKRGLRMSICSCQLFESHAVLSNEGWFSKLERLVVTKSWWDTVDILDRVVGSLVSNHPELWRTFKMEPLRQYLAETSYVDHQLLRKEKTNVQLMKRFCSTIWTRQDFLSTKPSAGPLRDYSKPTRIE